MSTYNYGPISATATKLIAKFGAPVVFTKPGTTVPADAARPWRGSDPASVESRTVSGVVTAFEQKELNDRIRDTDLKLLVSYNDVGWSGWTYEDMKNATRVQSSDGKTYEATDISGVAPNGTNIVMTFRLRL